MGMNDSSIAWAAGLFEGEGSFSANRQRKYVYPIASLKSTDEDVIRRFCEIVGVGSVTGPYPNGVYRVNWQWHIQNREGFAQFVQLVLPYLGKRRRAQLDRVLASATPVLQRQGG